MLKSVLKSIWPARHYAIKSFSYYLPAPPKRASGYQEKELDQIISRLSEQGYELLDMSSQAHSADGHGGVWVFCRMGALTKKAAATDINVDYQEMAGLGSDAGIPLDPDIVHDR